MYFVFQQGSYSGYPTCGLIVVDIDALELQIGVAVVGAGRVDTVLVRDHLPELEWKTLFFKHYDSSARKTVCTERIISHMTMLSAMSLMCKFNTSKLE